MINDKFYEYVIKVRNTYWFIFIIYILMKIVLHHEKKSEDVLVKTASYIIKT